MSGAVCADCEAGLGDRVAAARQVEHEKRHDERTKSIDERAAEKNPRGRRKRAQVVVQRLQSNSTRRRIRRCARIAPASVPMLFQMMSLTSATRSGRKYCHASMKHENVTPRNTVSTYVWIVGRSSV